MTTTTTRPSKARKTYTPASPEDRAAAVQAAHAAIADAVTSITTSAQWREYLAFGARFHRYSFNNIVWMYQQATARNMSTLSRVAGFGTWRNLGHPVCKGQTGLRIFAPMMVPVKPGEKGYDPSHKKERFLGFKIVSVFDAQQVSDPDTLPVDPASQAYRASAITGDVPAGMWDALSAVARAGGYTLRFGASGKADGYTDPLKHEIVIGERFRDNVARATAIAFHELAHMMLHTDTDDDGSPLFDYATHRGVAETEAEGTAFVSATYFGIDMGSTSAGYVAGWSKDDAAQIVKAGTNIMKTAKKIIDDIEKALAA